MCNDAATVSIKRKTLADVTIKDIDIVLATLLFFAPTDGSGGGAYSLVRYGLIAYLVLKNILCCKSIPIVMMLLSAFSALMAYSTWINTHSPTWSFSGFMFGMGIVAVILVYVDACCRLSTEIVLKRVLVIFIVAILLNDLMMVVLPYNRSDSSTVYLIGNKFIVSYAHCLLSGLMLVCYRDKITLNRIIVIIGAFMSYFSGSSTGAMMMVAMLALTFVPAKTRFVIANPLFLAASVAVLNILIWGQANLFQMPEFQNFVVNVLHKNPNMTGREQLYAVTFDLVAMKPR